MNDLDPTALRRAAIANRASDAPELWGGIECSHVMIGDEFRDQLAENGHFWRDRDLDRIASLGIRTLRYPLLWVHAAADPEGWFRRYDRVFAQLQAHGITPIVGFLHHGIGLGGMLPYDPGFIPGLADFAESVIRRYPHLRLFTPINEPVTTARISCLYGAWQPHTRDTPTFLRYAAACALATAEAMRRIRQVRPDAMLVQTEDVGRVFSTETLARQAAYENERRFLGFDLLCGRVDRAHRFWTELMEAGVDPADLDRLAAAPCPPGIIGIDHYLTSDRFLDHRIHRYPGVEVGGNHRQRYVDIAAVHVPDLAAELGLLARLREVHARYGLPVAVTEVHNGCTREEQLRWLIEAWDAAVTARREGIDLRAVTIWALFGSYDWNSMMRDRRGFYEAGAFDARHDPPRATAIAQAAQALAREGRYAHPLLAQRGWWHHDAGEGGAVLILDAADDVLATLQACCARRRIDTVRAATPTDREVWGALRVRNTGGGFAFQFRAAGVLTVETGAGDLLAATDAVLDLAIDGLTGVFRLRDLGPLCQFRLEPLQAVELTPATAQV